VWLLAVGSRVTHLATVATGVVGIALGGNLLWMALAVLFGCAFGTFFMAFHSTQGPQLGLPQMIQSRPQFGFIGALLVWGVALIAYIGFNAFNQILAAQTVLSLYRGDQTLTIIVFTILSVSIAVIGCLPRRAALGRVYFDWRTIGIHGGSDRSGAPAGR
jgi:purine-cytosine permease-like protein